MRRHNAVKKAMLALTFNKCLPLVMQEVHEFHSCIFIVESVGEHLCDKTRTTTRLGTL